jgi:hypothetical protein
MPMGMWPVGVLISVGCHTATSPTFIQKRKNKKIKNKKMSATIDQVVYYISRTWNINNNNNNNNNINHINIIINNNNIGYSRERERASFSISTENEHE